MILVIHAHDSHITCTQFTHYTYLGETFYISGAKVRYIIMINKKVEFPFMDCPYILDILHFHDAKVFYKQTLLM